MSLIRLMVPAWLVLTAFVSAEAQGATSAQPAPAAAVPAVKVATCSRNVCYRHLRGRGCFDSCKRTDLILQVKDSCRCCMVEVPVCIPACCTTAPTVCYLGLRRQVVEYSWPCGFKLKVVFDRCGDIIVLYYG